MSGIIQPYLNFSGGLNIETSNESLKDNECTILQNVDLSSRGSVKRRTGRTKIGSIPGKGQGMFFYYRSGQDFPDIIVAVSGRLYHLNNAVPEQIIITDGKNEDGTDKILTFQTELPIEAVQYRKDLFVATGTKIVEVTYDTSYKAKVVEPYKPTVLEIINIGTNAIATNPSTWVQDRLSNGVSIVGVTADARQGLLNQSVRFTGHLEKPSSVQVDYSWAYRKTGEGTFSTFKGASTDNFSDLTLNEVGNYDIRMKVFKKTYMIDDCSTVWSNNPGVNCQLSSTDSEGAEYGKCLVITGTPTDTSKPMIYKDVPLTDFTKGNTLDWWFKCFSEVDADETDDHQIWLYAEGNLDEPVLKIKNGNTYTGYYNGGGWVNCKSIYDNTLEGLDKIVRIAYFTQTYGSNYDPNNASGTDTASYLDQIKLYFDHSDSEYVLESYQVVGVIDPQYNPDTYSAIHTARSIRLHWDRILLAKDSKYPGQIYISDLNNPRYFPMNKRIDFSLDRQEPITSIVRYQSFLVIFTKTTISTLTGTHPQDGEVTDGQEYRISLINDTLGCIADKSAKVVGNNIIFLSSDGLYSLVPNPYTLTNMNVQKIDHPVKTEIVHDNEACALTHDEQYMICFPSENKILRFYYNQGSWVKDISSKLNILQFSLYNGVVYNLTEDGNVLQHEPGTFNDDEEVYDMIVQTKQFDLSASFNYKKLRRLFVLAKHYQNHSVNLITRVWSDSRMVMNPTTGEAVVNDDWSVTWQSKTEPNFHFYNGSEFGEWILGQSTLGEAEMSVQETKVKGKGRRVRISFTHNEDHACEIFGFGIEFKLGKP